MAHIFRPAGNSRRKCAFIADFVPRVCDKYPARPRPARKTRGSKAPRRDPRRVRPGFATRWEAELEIALYGGADCLPMRSGMSLRTVVAWYAHFERARRVSERTIEGYLSVLERLLTPELSDRPMSDLQPIDLTIVLAPVRSDKLAAKSKDEHARIVARFFKAACQYGFVLHDISDAMVRQNATTRHPRHDEGAPQEHFDAVRAVAGQAASLVFELSVTVFAAAEAIERMEWRDVDFPGCRIFIPYPPMPGQDMADPAQRDGRWRPMGKELLAAVLRWRAVSFACAPGHRLLMRPDGTAMPSAEVAELVHGAQVRAGLNGEQRYQPGQSPAKAGNNKARKRGMPRGLHLLADFRHAAIIAVAGTVRSLKTLELRVGRHSVQGLTAYSRYLLSDPKRRLPVADIELRA